MTKRKPVVVTTAGLADLPTGDTINAFFTGSAPLPALTLTVLSGTSVVTVAPKAAGDALAVGECILVTPGSALPAGLNISYAVVSAPNQVTVGFTASVAITASTMSWTVCALR